MRAASISCPCCHAASDKPIVDLDRNEVIWRGRLHVGPRKAEILSVLAESFGKPVHVNDLVMRVYASQETPGAHATIYSALSKARPKLRAIGLRVEGVPGTHGIRMFAA